MVYEAQDRIVCKCGHIFCFGCGANWHEPVLCKFQKKWTEKCDEDAGTASWITLNTKDCPKCKVPIEKNGGCNHMVSN